MAAVVLFFVLGLYGTAQAQTGTCSGTNFVPGQSISVSGSGGTPGHTATLLFNGSVIGATTIDGFGNFTVSGTIPAGTTPGTYNVSVTFTAQPTIVPCSVTVQAAPAPTASPIPPADPDDDDDDDDLDALAAAIEALAASGGGQQQQQQQQLVPIPVVAPVHHVSSGASLPKTGANTAEIGGAGMAVLLLGVIMVLMGRRRRFAGWIHPVLIIGGTPPTQVSAPAPPAGLTEADLVLPQARR